MAITDRYEVLTTLRPDCHRARDRRTGAAVLLHTLADASEAIQLLRDSGLLLDSEERAGQAWLVTQDRADLIDLPTWVLRHRAKEPGEASRMFWRPQNLQTGEFTQLFSSPEPLAKETAPAPAKLDAGEVGGTALDVTQTIQFVEPGAAKAPAVAKPAAGEFTRLFPATESTPKPAGKPDPGEFTMFFQPPESATPDKALRSSSASGQLPVPQTPVPIQTAPPAAPGEFTRLFRTPADSPLQLGSETSGMLDERTRLFTVPAEPQPGEVLNPPENAIPFQESNPSRASDASEFDSFYDSPYESNEAVMDPKPSNVSPSVQPPRIGSYGSEYTDQLRGSEPEFRYSNQPTNPDATVIFTRPPESPRPHSSDVAQNDEAYDAVIRPRPAAAPRANAVPPPPPESKPALAGQNKILLSISIALGALLVIAIVMIVILFRRH